MTTYRLFGVTQDDEGTPVVQLVVGKRDRLEHLPLTREEAWRIATGLLAVLQRSEGAS